MVTHNHETKTTKSLRIQPRGDPDVAINKDSEVGIIHMFSHLEEIHAWWLDRQGILLEIQKIQKLPIET